MNNTTNPDPTAAHGELRERIINALRDGLSQWCFDIDVSYLDDALADIADRVITDGLAASPHAEARWDTINRGGSDD